MTSLDVKVGAGRGPQETAPAPARVRLRCALLFIVIALAAFLRFHRLGSQSLWSDEGLTVRILRLPADQMLGRIRDWEQTPPVYYYLMKPWVAVFGDSEAALRFPSAVFGTLAVAALYVAVRRAFDARAALVAAMLLALSPYQIAYSQEARAYALFMLLAIGSCDLFGRLFSERLALLDAAYVAATTLLLYTHLYGIFIVAAQLLAYALANLIRKRGRLDLLRWLYLNVAIVALYSAYFHTVWIWLHDVSRGFWVKSVTLDDISRAYEIYAGSAPLLIALAALVVIGIWRSRNAVASTLWLGVMLLSIVVPVVLSVATRPTFSPRYGIAASLGLYALAAAGATSISNLRFQIPIGIILAVMSVRPTTLPDPKPQWREAARYLEANMRHGDFAAINRKGATCMYDYYVHRADVRRIGFDGQALPVSQPLDDGRHIWLVLYTSEIPANAMIRRGNWVVGKQRMFRGVLVLELMDP